MNATRRVRGSERGFSLVELLVVIIIIGVVVALVFPALGGARNAAKAASTRQLVASIGSAIDQFQIDNRRLPGVFSASEMGHPDNQNRGFTSMQNAMLELAPGGERDGPGAGVVQVGPAATRTTFVSPDLIASSNTKRYLTIEGKFFQRVMQSPAAPGIQVNPAAEGQVPDVVDSFGNPVVLWTVDTTAVEPVTTLDRFARINSGPAGNGQRARVYWAQNAAYFGEGATNVGRSGRNQSEESLLGFGTPDVARQNTLAALMGSSQAPDDLAKPVDQILPNQPRGTFMLHSAGVDGTFLGEKDKGGRANIVTVSPDAGQLFYGLNFKTSGGGALTGSDGKPTSIDPIARFDDIVQSGG